MDAARVGVLAGVAQALLEPRPHVHGAVLVLDLDPGIGQPARIVGPDDGRDAGFMVRSGGHRRTKDTVAQLQLLLALVAVMWVLEIVDVALDNRLDRYGIEPRELDGLDGVLTAPFLHVGFGHLLGNTIPFVAWGW